MIRSLQVEAIALGNQADVGQLFGGQRALDVRLDRVILQARMAKPTAAARSLRNRRDFDHRVAAVNFADHVSIAGTHPSNRWSIEPFEIKHPRQARHDSNTSMAFQITNLGFDRHGDMFVHRSLANLRSEKSAVFCQVSGFQCVGRTV